MKAFSQLKIWIILIVSCFLTVAVISSCSTEKGTQTGTATTTSGGDDDDRDAKSDKTDRKPRVEFEFPSCSGDDCCDKDDNDCDKWCKGNSYLDLSGKEATACLESDKDTVRTLAKDLFKKVLDSPTYDELADLDEDKIKLIGAAVEKFGSELWEDRIKGLSATKAKLVLSWIAREDLVIQIFQAIDEEEEDEGVKIFKELLKKVGRGTGDYTQILTGLEAPLQSDKRDDSDDQRHVMAIANKENNDGVIQYIHENIIVHEEEGICGADESNNNYPDPDKGSNKPYGAHLDGDAGERIIEGVEQQACIFAVYCKIAPYPEGASNTRHADNDDFREDIAESALDYVGDVSEFIIEQYTEGGLNPVDDDGDLVDITTATPATPKPVKMDDDDGEKWTKKACDNLRGFWKNKTGFDLGLN